ncbi:hypothetical protein D3C71_1541490 [compost metagenome]
MAKKRGYDLSNVGGNPKTWMQKEHEKSLVPGLGAKGGLLLWGAGALVLLTIAALIWGGFRLIAG